MSRLIDVDALRKDFKVAERCDDCPQCNRHCNADVVLSRRDICEMLDDAEIVDAEPVQHGRWVHHKGGLSDHYECTVCGVAIVLTAKFRYCPYCGAKMDGDKNEAD